MCPLDRRLPRVGLSNNSAKPAAEVLREIEILTLARRAGTAFHRTRMPLEFHAEAARRTSRA
jgi:hypothetical protein